MADEGRPGKKGVKDHVVQLLRGGHAHATFEKAIARWPPPLRGKRPRGLPYSGWELLEHMRLAQWDILEFSRNPAHVSPEWPRGYWPAQTAPASATAWTKSVRAFQADLETMVAMVSGAADLLAPFPHGDGQTLLREALLVADHNAYHLGQLILVRRLLGAWRD